MWIMFDARPLHGFIQQNIRLKTGTAENIKTDADSLFISRFCAEANVVSNHHTGSRSSARTTLAAHSHCLVRDVHHLLHRSDERVDGPAPNERAVAHGSPAGRGCCRHFFLGISVPADARRASRTDLEREACCSNSSDRVGNLLRRNRAGEYGARVLDHASRFGADRGRRLACGVGAGCALVSAPGARARERLLDAMSSDLGGDLFAVFRMAAEALELARAADRRRCFALFMATHL